MIYLLHFLIRFSESFLLLCSVIKYFMILFIFDFDNTLGDAYGPYGEGNIFRTKTLVDTEKATEIYAKYRR